MCECTYTYSFKGKWLKYLSIEISWEHSFTGGCNAANVLQRTKNIISFQWFYVDYYKAILLTISATAITPTTPTTGTTIATTTTQTTTKPGKYLFKVLYRLS